LKDNSKASLTKSQEMTATPKETQEKESKEKELKEKEAKEKAVKNTSTETVFPGLDLIHQALIEEVHKGQKKKSKLLPLPKSTKKQTKGQRMKDVLLSINNLGSAAASNSHLFSINLSPQASTSNNPTSNTSTPTSTTITTDSSVATPSTSSSASSKSPTQLASALIALLQPSQEDLDFLDDHFQKTAAGEKVVATKGKKSNTMVTRKSNKLLSARSAASSTSPSPSSPSSSSSSSSPSETLRSKSHNKNSHFKCP